MAEISRRNTNWLLLNLFPPNCPPGRFLPSPPPDAAAAADGPAAEAAAADADDAASARLALGCGGGASTRSLRIGLALASPTIPQMPNGVPGEKGVILFLVG